MVFFQRRRVFRAEERRVALQKVHFPQKSAVLNTGIFLKDTPIFRGCRRFRPLPYSSLSLSFFFLEKIRKEKERK